MRIFRCRQIIIGGSSEIERRMIGMMTVKQMSSLTGVSVRTLQFYDEIGLLKPAQVTEAGYRMKMQWQSCSRYCFLRSWISH